MPLNLYDKQQDRPLKNVKYVIGIAAGKGGVGKSTLTVHLADSLRRSGCKVGVLDADIYGPSLRHMLPEDETPYEENGVLYPALSRGLKVISMAYFRGRDEASAIRGPIASNLIKQFINNIDWGELDYLLIDFPPGTGDIQLTLCQQALLKGVILVTTPQEVSLLDVRKALSLFDQFKAPILGVVENMSYFQYPGLDKKIAIFGQGGGQRLADESDIPLLATLPLDPELNASNELGMTYAPPMPTTTSKAFLQLAVDIKKLLPLY